MIIGFTKDYRPQETRIFSCNKALVFFFSDNGGGPIEENGSKNGASNEPLRDGKGSVYEGGVRVPFVVSWPGTLPVGQEYEPPVSSVDVFATALAVAETPMPTDRVYDSVNLLPFLTGERDGSPHPSLFWRRAGPARWAIRQGNTKLVRESGRADELYNLRADIAESRNVISTQRDLAERLGATLDAWNAQLMDPAFEGTSGRK